MKELREFNTLKELKDTHQKDVNEFPFIYVFAFSDKEFISKMAEEIKKRKPNCTGITTMEGVARHVASIGAGAFIFKEDSAAMREMFERHEAERKHFNKTEKNLVATILYEMNNHEYGYTRDRYDTLMALGKTDKDLKTDERFAKAWKKAEKKCFKSFDDAVREEESLKRAYGTWRDDYELEG
jgi:hypothetical protein